MESSLAAYLTHTLVPTSSHHILERNRSRRRSLCERAGITVAHLHEEGRASGTSCGRYEDEVQEPMAVVSVRAFYIP
jgi:hypothetical protein